MQVASVPRRHHQTAQAAGSASAWGRTADLALLYGQVAGALFICGSLLGLPASLLLEPGPGPAVYLLTLLGVVSGLICLAIPWERLGPSWFRLLAVVATIEVAAVVWAVGPQFNFYFLFVAIYAAYVMESRRDVAIQLALIAVAIIVPVVAGPDASRSSATEALIAIPSFSLAAALVVVLREKLADSERAYRRFAQEALGLVGRIRGQLPPAQQRRPMSSDAEWERAFAAPSERIGELVGQHELAVPAAAAPALLHRWRLPLLGLAGLFALPLFGVGLAAAGVALPDPVVRSYEAIGLDLAADDDAPAAPEGPATRSLGPDTAKAVEAVARANAAEAPAAGATAPDSQAAGAAAGPQPGSQTTAASAAGDSATGPGGAGAVESAVAPSGPVGSEGPSQVSATPGPADADPESGDPNGPVGGVLEELGLLPDAPNSESNGLLPIGG